MMSTQQRIATGMIALAVWVTALNGWLVGSSGMIRADDYVAGCDKENGRYSYRSVARTWGDEDTWEEVSDSWERVRDGCGEFMQSLRLKCYTHHHTKRHTLYPEFPPHWSATYGYYETCWRPFPYTCPRCTYPAIVSPTQHRIESPRPVLPPPAAQPPMVDPAEAPAETVPAPPEMTYQPPPTFAVPALAEPIVPVPMSPEERLQTETPVLPLIYLDTDGPAGYSGIEGTAGFRIIDAPIAIDENWQPSRPSLR